MLVAGAILEFLPQSLFNAIPTVWLSWATEGFMKPSYDSAEQLYPGFGRKFVTAQLLLFAVFVVTVVVLKQKSWVADAVERAVPRENPGYATGKALLAAGGLALMPLGLLAFWFFFPFDPGGAVRNVVPIVARSIPWAIAIVPVLIFPVIWRRTFME